VNPAEDAPRAWERRFFAGLDQHGSVFRAAAEAGVTRRRVYQLKDSDPKFAARWTETLEGKFDDAAGTVMQRAIDGWDEITTDPKGGKTVRRIWNPKLAMWVLERRRPAEWGPKALEAQDDPSLAKRVILEDNRGEVARLEAKVAELEARLEGDS